MSRRPDNDLAQRGIELGVLIRSGTVIAMLHDTDPELVEAAAAPATYPTLSGQHREALLALARAAREIRRIYGERQAPTSTT
jgi:hypothetical protein